MNYLRKYKGVTFYIIAEPGTAQRYSPPERGAFELVVGHEYAVGPGLRGMFLGIDPGAGEPCFALVDDGAPGDAASWRFHWCGNRKALARMTRKPHRDPALAISA